MPRARNPEAGRNLTPGWLSYLPKRPDGEVPLPSDSEIPEGCYDHPVLILSTDLFKKEAKVLILTSFGGKSLDKHSQSARIRAFHLPIYPSPAHPDNGTLLFLDQDLELPQKAYVKTETCYSISWEQLQADYREPGTGRNYKLAPDSFTKVLELINSGHAKPTPSKIPPPASIDYPSGWDLMHSVKAANVRQYGTINQPIYSPPRPPKPSKYSVRAPVAASTLQSVARSREGVAAETDRYLAQWRESQTWRQEACSTLPIYRTSPPADVPVGSRDPRKILRRLFVVLVLVLGCLLGIAWWQRLL